MKDEMEGVTIVTYEIPISIQERLEVEGYEIRITDGTGRELHKDIVYFAKRENGEVIELDSYWLYGSSFDTAIQKEEEGTHLLMQAMDHVMQKREEFVIGNETQLNKKIQFLRRAFDSQYQNTMDKLEKYRNENVDNRNSALINQMKAQLLDIEDRRKSRLEEVEERET
ncbi:hypothetical protein ACT7CT_24955 [Bacillus sanguinis]